MNFRRAEERGLLCGDVVAIDRLRNVERGECVEDELVVVGAIEAAHRSKPRKFDLVLQLAVEAVDIDSVGHVFQINGEQLASGGSGAAKGVALFWQNILPCPFPPFW